MRNRFLGEMSDTLPVSVVDRNVSTFAGAGWATLRSLEMRGFHVWLPDGAMREFEASRYEVDGAGELTIWGGSDTIESFAPGSWVEIRRVGTPLSDEWPYPRMHLLMRNVSELLIRRYGGWIHGLDEDRLSDWRLNDYDEFLSAILEASSLDPKAIEDHPQVKELRRLIAVEFGLRPPRDRRERRSR